MGDQTTSAPAGADQNKVAEVGVDSVKARSPSTDNSLKPNDVARYVENIAKNPSGVNVDQLLAQIDPTGEFSPTRTPGDRFNPPAETQGAPPELPNLTVDDKGRLHDEKGRFKSGAAIEAEEESAARTERPAPDRQPAAKPGAERQPTGAAYRTQDGREVSAEEIELALRVSERESSIRAATDRRMRELEERENGLTARDRELTEREQTAAQFEDMVLRDPQRAVKFYEATTGRRWPGAQSAVDDVADGAFEPDERAARGARRPAKELTEDDIERRVDERLEARFKTHEQRQVQARAEDSFWNHAGTAIDAAIKGVDEFTHIEQDIEAKIGRELARSIKAGRIALPNAARGFRGSSPKQIADEVKTIAASLLATERKRLNGWAATRFKEHSETTSRMPDPGRGAATIAGNSHLDPNTVDLPTNIRGIEELATRFMR